MICADGELAASSRAQGASLGETFPVKDRKQRILSSRGRLAHALWVACGEVRLRDLPGATSVYRLLAGGLQ